MGAWQLRQRPVARAEVRVSQEPRHRGRDLGHRLPVRRRGGVADAATHAGTVATFLGDSVCVEFVFGARKSRPRFHERVLCLVGDTMSCHAHRGESDALPPPSTIESAPLRSVLGEILLENHPPTHLTENPYRLLLIKITVQIPTDPLTPTKVGILKHVDLISWKCVSVTYQPWYNSYPLGVTSQAD